MNQILSFEEKGIGSSMNKAAKFFAVSMIAFGAILTFEGGYSIAKAGKEASSIITMDKAQQNKPEITFEQNNSKLNINIKGAEEISKVTYFWNNEDEEILSNVLGNKNLTKEIDVPMGTNKLTVKVIYANSSNYTYEISQKFTSNPTKINLSVVKEDETTKIKIQVDDSNGIDYISYKWNDAEEKIEKANASNNKEMELTTDIPFGLNTLTVTAINKLGQKSEKRQEVKGTSKPVIMATLTQEGILNVEVTANDNIDSVEFKINEQDYVLNIADFIDQGYTIDQLNEVPGLTLETNNLDKIVKVKYDLPLEDETNEIEIKAITQYASETVAGTLVKPNI